jgi:hypothetical protein
MFGACSGLRIGAYLAAGNGVYNDRALNGQVFILESPTYPSGFRISCNELVNSPFTDQFAVNSQLRLDLRIPCCYY